MAVLLECASCYQHYTVPQQALRQPTFCPWCGASSAGPKSKKKSSGKNRHGSKRVKSRSAHRPAVVDARRLPERRSSDDNGSAVLDKQKRPAGTNGVAVLPVAKNDVPPTTDVGAQPPQSIEKRLPPLRRNVTGSTDSAPAAPPLGPPGPPRSAGVFSVNGSATSGVANAVRLRLGRRPPELLWLVIGIGLGACIVLGVLALALPGGLRRQEDRNQKLDSIEEPNGKAPSAVKADRSLRNGNRQPLLQNRDDDRQSVASNDSKRDDVPRADRESGIQNAKPRDEPRSPPAARWTSERPPPIDDPGDDSPGIGLKVPERAAAKSIERESSVPLAKLVRPDDAAAIQELAAAKIGFHKDETSGLVDRLDGSFRMTDALMAHVAKLPNLTQLKLSLSNIGDAGLVHVSNLTGLKELHLNESKVTDASLAHLDKLTALEKLDLEKTAVSDEGIPHLKRLDQLQHLDVRGTKITPAGVKSLKEAIPGAKIRAQ